MGKGYQSSTSITMTWTHTNNNKNIYGTPSRKSLEHLQRHKDTLISSHTYTPHKDACVHPPPPQDTCMHTHTRHIHTHTHSTNTCITGDGLVKWQISIYVEGKRWVFSFDLKEESEDECLTGRGSEFQSTGPMYWKVLLPILGTWKMLVSVAEWKQWEGE